MICYPTGSLRFKNVNHSGRVKVLRCPEKHNSKLDAFVKLTAAERREIITLPLKFPEKCFPDGFFSCEASDSDEEQPKASDKMGKARKFPDGLGDKGRDAATDPKHKAPTSGKDESKKKAKLTVSPPPLPKVAHTVAGSSAEVPAKDHHSDPKKVPFVSTNLHTPQEDVKIHKGKLVDVIEGKGVKDHSGLPSDALLADTYHVFHQALSHVTGLVKHVEHLSRQNDLLSHKLNTIASTHEKEIRVAYKARDNAKMKLVMEESKVSALEKDVDKFKAAATQLEVEKASLVDEHQREVEQLKKQIKSAEKDPANADEVCKTWNAVSDMYENVLSNLYEMVAPTLSPEMKETYEKWLAIIKVPVKEAKEVVFIPPEAYDSDDLGEEDGDATTPDADPPLTTDLPALDEALVSTGPTGPSDPPVDVRESAPTDSALPSTL